jgi:hypothetical protein
MVTVKTYHTRKMVQQYLKKPQQIELETDLGNDTATSYA